MTNNSFAPNDILQSVYFPSGTYSIVLQWDDSIYSLGQLPGAKNDFDVYITDDAQTKFYGLNRKNNWGDPFEVLPFVVKATTNANIVIARTWSVDPPNTPMKIKYVK